MNDVIWEEPPAEALEGQPRTGTTGAWLAELKVRPGQWARLDHTYNNESSARAAAGGIRNGNHRGVAKGDYEAIAHKGTVWARYMVGVDKGDPGDDGSADDDERKAYPAKVRAWAKLKGIEVKAGRLPDRVVSEYEEDTGDMRPSRALSAVE